MKLSKVYPELVRNAALAPSSHNSQCWKFQLLEDQNTIKVLPDLDRRCPVVDPDDHHLYVTLGCAIENLVIAAQAKGFDTEVDNSNPIHGVSVRLSPMQCNDIKATDLFDAITKRQCSRSIYDGQALSKDELQQLGQAGRGGGVRVILVTDHTRIKTIQDHVIQANTAQMDNPDFKKELKSWVRFSHSEATTMGDGLYGKCMGSPSAPRWIGSLVFDYLVSTNTENSKIVKQISSSAGIALFVSDKNDEKHWVEVGRCYERFALQATTLDVRNAFLNQPVEEAGVRLKFQEAMGFSEHERVDLVVRFGKGPTMPRSHRRPLEDIIV